MELGMIGLGRMGANMVRRLIRDGHECVAYDVNPGAVKQLARGCRPPGTGTVRGSGVVGQCVAVGVVMYTYASKSEIWDKLRTGKEVIAQRQTFPGLVRGKFARGGYPRCAEQKPQ